MSNVGYATLQVIPSMKGMEKALNKDAGPAFKKVGTDLGEKTGENFTKAVADKVELPKKLVKEADALGEKSGKTFASNFQKKADGISFSKVAAGLGTLFAGGALLSFGKDSFEAFSNEVEAGNKVKVVFGEAAQGITDFTKSSAKDLGLSKAAALDAAGTFGNLFRAMGIGVDPSADMSKSLLTLGADLASFNNTPVDEALVALKAGLVGETEPLRRFGINLNEARIKAEALRLGLVHGNVNMVDVEAKNVAVAKAQAKVNDLYKSGKATSLELSSANAALATAQQNLDDAMVGSVPELDAASKAQAAYSLIMQDSSLAQGDFARTADGAANKSKTASAAFEDLKASFGEKIAPAGNWVLDKAITGLDAVKAWIDEKGPGIKQWFTDTFGADPGQNFRNGLQLIQDKLDEIFGKDKVGNFNTGKAVLADSWWGDLLDQIGKVPEALGNAWIEVRDRIIDPLFGSIQDLQKNVLDPLFGSLQDFQDNVLDPMWGTIQDIASFSGFDDETIGKVGSVKGFGNWPHADSGAVITGSRGAAVPVIAHAGETIVPTHKMPNLLKGGGQGGGGFSVGDVIIQAPIERQTAFRVRNELRRMAIYAGART